MFVVIGVPGIQIKARKRVVFALTIPCLAKYRIRRLGKLRSIAATRTVAAGRDLSENGRWGPFIRFGKDMLKLSKSDKGDKYAPEELAALSLDEVKKMIVAQVPNAFDAKKKGAKKAPAKKGAVIKKIAAKSPAKKTVVKKAASKKPAPKKAAVKKNEKISGFYKQIA